MKNKVYVLLKTVSSKYPEVYKVSSSKPALNKLKRELVEEQGLIINLRNLIQSRKKRFAIEWNRNNGISFTLEDISTRERNMWQWVTTQLEIYIQELFIPDSIIEKCNLDIPFTLYDFVILESEML